MLVDLLVVLAGLVGAWASVFYVAGQIGWPAALVLGPLPALALFWRRQAPFAVFGVAVVAALAYWVFEVAVNGAHAVLVLSLYSIARHEAARSGRIALGVCLALVAVTPLRQPFQGPGNTILQGLFVLVVWVLATNVALRQAYLQALEERAARLERERDADVRAATLTERTRIAREMHDVVAHHVSVMVVQAEGATWAIDTAPDQAKAAVTTIAETGRSTLTELRRLLGVLRDGEAESVAPQPDLGAIFGLVDQFRLSGLDVRCSPVPAVGDVPESVQLAVYRVVEEGLTNALKHVGVGARVDVEFEYLEPAGEIRVEVRDGGSRRPDVSSGVGAGVGLSGVSAAEIALAKADVPAVGAMRSRAAAEADVPAPGATRVRAVGEAHGLAAGAMRGRAVAVNADLPGAGHGLIGINERVALFGGRAQIGPTPEGGFAVRAWFPVGAA
ncbi:histidine kinase [Kineosporia sp. NBRC 101677]|uniref:sensor histidine kinase n=1 Tax=Kineosporia sp. NBRC 101677 TaxID=3032197 RepID=UPI002552EFB3|nr:histidine kinase [Kineosporia sp. NBRC 101677]